MVNSTQRDYFWPRLHFFFTAAILSSMFLFHCSSSRFSISIIVGSALEWVWNECMKYSSPITSNDLPMFNAEYLIKSILVYPSSVSNLVEPLWSSNTPKERPCLYRVLRGLIFLS